MIINPSGNRLTDRASGYCRNNMYYNLLGTFQTNKSAIRITQIFSFVLWKLLPTFNVLYWRTTIVPTSTDHCCDGLTFRQTTCSGRPLTEKCRFIDKRNYPLNFRISINWERQIKLWLTSIKHCRDQSLHKLPSRNVGIQNLGQADHFVKLSTYFSTEPRRSRREQGGIRKKFSLVLIYRLRKFKRNPEIWGTIAKWNSSSWC